jgi:transketolase
MHNKVINRAADNIRILSAAMVEKAKSGHPGGAMGGADFINILFTEFLRYDPADPTWHMRDRFFLDPGHMSPMLYSVLRGGKYKLDELKNFRQWGSPTPGHPELEVSRGVENTSGPLGQGHTSAVGAAIAERFLCARFGEWMSHKTFAFISDGGVQEEISQGAGRIAGFLGLSNLIMFYDSNDIQLSTNTSAVTHEDTAKKYEAWGWSVSSIDGNSADQIRAALTKAIAEKDKPSLIIGKTVMGRGGKGRRQQLRTPVPTHGMPWAGGRLVRKSTQPGRQSGGAVRAFFPRSLALRESQSKRQKAAARKANSRNGQSHPGTGESSTCSSRKLPPLNFEKSPTRRATRRLGTVLGWPRWRT